VSDPRWIDAATPAVHLRALSWGAQAGRIALCPHGFPDTAYGWRKLAPRLVAAGDRAVHARLRAIGVFPVNESGGPPRSSIPSHGSYHIGALMDDVLQVLNAAGPTGQYGSLKMWAHLHA
jgi:hypothetical protein